MVEPPAQALVELLGSVDLGHGDDVDLEVHVDHVCLLERFLQLAGDFAGRGLNSMLHDFGRACQRLVESFSGGWLAGRDEPGLAGCDFLSRFVELLAWQGPAPEPLGDDPDVRAVHPLEHVRLAGS